jgi:predicted outer membrane repeat protein
MMVVGLVFGLGIVFNAAAATTWYVTPDGSDTNGGSNWSDGFATISNAVAVASDGDEILVSNGVYTVYAQTQITNAVTVRGLDQDTTIIQRSVTGATTEPTHRIFYVNHADAVLESLTVSRGTTHNTDSSNYGGGIWLEAGRVNDCKITSCYSKGNDNDRGVGMYVGSGGVASNCWIFDNPGHIYTKEGGGAYVTAGGLLTDSVVEDNQAGDGAGVYVDGGIVRRSSIINNTAPQKFGGGAYIKNSGQVEFCVITNNTVTLNSDKLGAGVYLNGSGTLRNCLVAYNTAKGAGGGVYMTGGLVESCTVADNKSYTDGGGIWASGGAILNTIGYFNSAIGSGDNHLLSGTAAMTWSCTTPAVTGDGNESGDPDFVDRATGYTLRLTSPAVDAGNIQGWMATATDLDGNSRELGDTVDMGVYERPVNSFECDFSADPIQGGEPLDVQFTAYVSGSTIATNNLV